MPPIDVILTSCGRWDLLHTTLRTFFSVNTYPVNKFIINEDKGMDNYSQLDFETVHNIQREFNKTLWLCSAQREGQIISLDRLMEKVTTEYYFTLEDDWKTIKDGFIERSIEVLEKYPKCNQVQLRGFGNINGHPAYLDDGIWKLQKGYNKKWDGFGFNPSVRRLSDYNLLEKYSNHTKFKKDHPWESEIAIGKIYSSMGYFTAVLPEIYITHIGDNRGIRK